VDDLLREGFEEDIPEGIPKWVVRLEILENNEILLEDGSVGLLGE